ncbi:hypothetical protein COW36_19420 [bacterium (Candidatus Blackallbacteria) CG17_big_fil_post_rev_8_21_14_2_50_48_46]|uniref:Response regulatory domain-containing protein n=1 Tax=bacterium (Candidatus Blackallbacteria) CG17_big_fil_post_rev_8_21_14_2_50_48_46 TaxID=2014261 RepID=A0A2M7G089_9BACT|nr:MAG: hypothetical protein COW64_25050 [bacterium (Candidatus Blackallbacteria) CG18_big_fil_WC_8_21_14_2_50_49_26]PIW15093.1 MAG: hypothetical protein COW36_19420 [bacterium (Candidatus Blackallbacteria) CG17_big_fil_post_rev_8_21_14_2_50_48_46]PIW47584.1 MAG: hypothetical protein COW20_11900 [bacterium (Candidatus Blackallbacteria) CG13_big_fil_rev_8_21_14_2_50_49_14]
MQIYSVLVISPVYSTREMIARYLSSENLIVYTAENARDAVPIIEKLPLQAVIFELDLDQASGLDLLLWLNQRHSHLHPMLICDPHDTDLIQILRSQRASVVSRDNLNLQAIRNRLQTMLKFPRGTTSLFEQVSLFELVHLASQAQTSRRLSIRSPQTDAKAELTFQLGRVNHACLGEQTGEEAFFEIIRMKSGRFEELKQKAEVPQTIGASLNQLMSKSSLRVDEGGVKMPTTYCTVLSDDLSLGDYLSATYPEAEMELLYTDHPETALNQLKTKADLLIIDLDLPNFDAQAFLETLRHERVAMNVFLMGSQFSAPLHECLKREHVHRFFRKNLQFKELGDLIHHNFLNQQFQGRMYNLSLLGVLETFVYFKQPRLLEITDFLTGQTGQIFMAEGVIQHAVYDKQVGRDALNEMMQIQSGIFQQETYWAPAFFSLNVPVGRLFLYLNRIMSKVQAPQELPRDLLLQNGAVISLQPEKLSYLLAVSQG